ncbi:hypothetical protein ABZ863_12760 [Saccharomonospora sp. NPDC046836]|uniref:hypothetical protein n=1 Tax=Saccharomonospora sp. NPDC046836 TaxID=3156921 RepID=UPI003407E6F0
MKAITTVLLAATVGDIALIGSSYFHITGVADPTYPAAGGVVWHGYWWRSDHGHWGEPTVFHMHEGKPVPQLLTAAERQACGWGELP